MGMNFYLCEAPPCETCGRRFEGLHIGKSSYGWRFGLHVIPEMGINTLDDWRERWRVPGMVIVNEDCQVMSIEEMERRITEREKNRAIGQKPLARHAIDGTHCIGHGEGSWDYIVGEFS